MLQATLFGHLFEHQVTFKNRCMMCIDTVMTGGGGGTYTKVPCAMDLINSFRLRTRKVHRCFPRYLLIRKIHKMVPLSFHFIIIIYHHS